MIDETACVDSQTYDEVDFDVNYEITDEEIIRNLKMEINELQATIARFGRERDVLSTLYANTVFELTHVRDNLRWTEKNVTDMRDCANNLRRILFKENKVRMSKETEKEIRKFLSF